LVLEEGHDAAIRRHARIAQVAARLVEYRAGRVFEAVAAVAEVVHDGHRGTVRRPVGLADVFRNGAWRAAEGHARQRAAVQALFEMPGAHDEDQLTLLDTDSKCTSDSPVPGALRRWD
jgi:hypothetical protein